MSKRYGQLPSQTLALGNSIDVNCAIIAMQYESFLHKKHAGKDKGQQLTNEHSQEELMGMLNRVKARK